MNSGQGRPDRVAAQLRQATALRPRIAIVLGTGFRAVADGMERDVTVPFSKLAGFRRPSVRGHAGELIIGRLGRTETLLLSGRSHYYEGGAMPQITFPIRVLAAFGVTHLLLTNAAGGINKRFRPGDLMLIRDHINLLPENPLRGIEESSRFLDLSRAYDKELAKLLRAAARCVRVRIHSGVYMAVSGPSYETPAEIRAFARLGADAVGMSTVPEAIVARHCGMAVAGLSCISNVAAGLGQSPVAHEEVLATGERVREKSAELVTVFLELFGQKPQRK